MTREQEKPVDLLVERIRQAPITDHERALIQDSIDNDFGALKLHNRRRNLRTVVGLALFVLLFAAVAAAEYVYPSFGAHWASTVLKIALALVFMVAAWRGIAAGDPSFDRAIDHRGRLQGVLNSRPKKAREVRP